MGRFAKGASGNPKGRPPGSRNKSTVYFEQLLSEQGEALVQKTVQLALKGDTTALRLCLERICPPRKERTVEFPLPVIGGTASVSAILTSIVTGVSEGHLTASEGESLARIVETQIRVAEIEDFGRRLSDLEKLTNPKVGKPEEPGLRGNGTHQPAHV